MTWVEVLRFVNITLAILALGFMGEAWIKHRKIYSFKMKLLWISLAGWLILSVENDTEDLLKRDSWGLSDLLTFAVLIFTLFGVIMRQDYTQEPKGREHGKHVDE